MPNKIILTEQMRQQEDERYAELLNNLKECKILEDDFKLLKTRFLSNLKINLFEHSWDEASYIVPRNDLKDAINDHIIEYYIQKIIKSIVYNSS
jgi:hypothetical protein